VHRGEAGADRGWDKPRPPLYSPFDIGDRNGLAAGIAVHTRAFLGLKLEEFEFAGLLRGGGQQAESVQRVGEQESRCLNVEQIGTAFGELGQQVNNVEVVEQAVDERDHSVQHAGFTWGIAHVAQT
jgi:hypothetical protein